MFSLFVRRDGLIDPPLIGDFDAHCHILPGLDDGPSTTDGSLDIARILLDMGITTVAATPHVISDVHPNTTESILESVKKFTAILKDKGLPLSVLPGAEYYAENMFMENIRRNDILSFGPNKYVLFESPVENPPMILEDIIFHLKSGGYTPLLAHAERYRFLQKDPKMVDELKGLGVHFQVNHPSFSLPKTSRTGEMARKLYVKGHVNALGTDMHRATPMQPTREDTKRGFRLLRQR